MIQRIAILFLGLAAGFATSAQESISSINSDRPGQTFSSTVVSPGALTLQFGIETYWTGASNYYMHTNPIQFRYGLIKNLELNASFTRNFIHELGLDNDFDIGARYQLLDLEKVHLNILAGYGTSVVPKLNDNVSTVRFLFNFGIDAGQVSFGTSTGVMILGASGQYESGSTIYSTLNLAYNPNPRFSVFVDFQLVNFQQFNSGPYESPNITSFFESDMLQLGMSYQVWKPLRFDWNIGTDGWSQEYSFGPAISDPIKASIVHTSMGLTWRILAPKD